MIFDQRFLLKVRAHLIFFVFKFRKIVLSLTGADLTTKKDLFLLQKAVHPKGLV